MQSVQRLVPAALPRRFLTRAISPAAPLRGGARAGAEYRPPEGPAPAAERADRPLVGAVGPRKPRCGASRPLRGPALRRDSERRIPAAPPLRRCLSRSPPKFAITLGRCERVPVKETVRRRARGEALPSRSQRPGARPPRRVPGRRALPLPAPAHWDRAPRPAFGAEIRCAKRHRQALQRGWLGAARGASSPSTQFGGVSPAS